MDVSSELPVIFASGDDSTEFPYTPPAFRVTFKNPTSTVACLPMPLVAIEKSTFTTKRHMGRQQLICGSGRQEHVSIV